MIDVEEAQLIVFLSQNEKECVAEFQKLAKVVPPNRVSNLKNKFLKDFFLSVVWIMHELIDFFMYNLCDTL